MYFENYIHLHQRDSKLKVKKVKWNNFWSMNWNFFYLFIRRQIIMSRGHNSWNPSLLLSLFHFISFLCVPKISLSTKKQRKPTLISIVILQTIPSLLILGHPLASFLLYILHFLVLRKKWLQINTWAALTMSPLVRFISFSFTLFPFLG